MNLALCRKDTGETKVFIKNCTIRGRKYIGSNIKISGINKKLFDLVWTNDIAVELEDGVWDKNRDDFNHTSSPNYPAPPSTAEYEVAVGVRRFLSDLTYNQLENYIESNITDLNSAKEYLKELSKVVLAVSKLLDSKL